MAEKNQRWTIHLAFEIEAPSESAAKNEANRLGTQVAEQFKLDELPHTVGYSTSEAIQKDMEMSGSTTGQQVRS